MKEINDIQKLTFEFDDIESIEEVGYTECIDIEVEDDNSFTLANGIIVHNSAKAGLADGFGRKNIGYFATRGVPLNAYEVPLTKIAANVELNNIIKCLNLQLKAAVQNLTYEKIVLANDADADGAHIRMLYIAFFSKFAQSIIKEKRLCALQLPLICLKDKHDNIKKMFQTFNDYNDYIKNNDINGLKIKYFKGLGSWTKNELKSLVDKYGIDKFIEPLELDENAIQLIDDWIGKKNADKRKDYLKQNEFSIFSI